MGLTSNYLDGQTPLDEEEREGLRIRSVSTKAELNEFEQMNIEKAIEWTLSKQWNARQIFSEEFVRTLHHKMFADVWEWAGQFRKTNKNLGVGKHLMRTQLKALLDDCLYWTDNRTFPPEEIAIQFKHRLVSIHCFPNGNGRHSRLMTDVIMTKVFRKPLFTWGQKKSHSKEEIRRKYLSALRYADKGNIRPLLNFANS